MTPKEYWEHMKIYFDGDDDKRHVVGKQNFNLIFSEREEHLEALEDLIEYSYLSDRHYHKIKDILQRAGKLPEHEESK